MPTKVYGVSDDLVEIEGDITGEVCCYGTDDNPNNGVLIILSDGTLLAVKYGKLDTAIWSVTLVKQGSLFLRINPCTDENAKPYSDIAHFKDGLKWAYAATEWERIK